MRQVFRQREIGPRRILLQISGGVPARDIELRVGESLLYQRPNAGNQALGGGAGWLPVHGTDQADNRFRRRRLHGVQCGVEGEGDNPIMAAGVDRLRHFLQPRLQHRFQANAARVLDALETNQSIQGVEDGFA